MCLLQMFCIFLQVLKRQLFDPSLYRLLSTAAERYIHRPELDIEIDVSVCCSTYSCPHVCTQAFTYYKILLFFSSSDHTSPRLASMALVMMWMWLCGCTTGIRTKNSILKKLVTLSLQMSCCIRILMHLKRKKFFHLTLRFWRVMNSLPSGVHCQLSTSLAVTM